MKTIARYLLRSFRVLCIPMERARAVRKDEHAQVMVMTAVMIFIMGMFAISTVNTSTQIYNRIRVQNAVDAAADGYALWQARGANFAQHLNDLHYDLVLAAYIAEMAACVIRLTVCLGLNLARFNPFCWYCTDGAYRLCCMGTSVTIEFIENAQYIVSDIILLLQSITDTIFPLLGFLIANSLANGNGADPIIGGLVSVVESILGGVGIDVNVAQGLANTPLIGELYVFNPNLISDPTSLFTLNLSEAPRGNHPAPWTFPSALLTACNIPPCFDSDTFDCAMSNNESGSECGWEDTFYTGFPGYQTWITAKMQINKMGGYDFHRWLNPGKGDPNINVKFENFDDFVFAYEGTPSAATGRVLGSEFRNPVLTAIASAQPFGHDDVDKQPVIDRSSGSGFQWMRPQLITVFHGDPPDDTDVVDQLIWH